MDRRTLPTKLTTQRVQIFETDRAALSSIAWDTFAAKCGASFRCAHGALAAWQLSDSMFFRLRLFEIYGGEFGGKIGQCAVAVSRRQSYFIDGIQLSPGDEALWEASMTAVLGRLGPGRYRYGSPWSIEKAREQSLQLLRNVSVEVVESHVVQGVDFNRWKSWDDYFGAVSNNARRNAKKARIRFPALQIWVNRGLSTLRHALAITNLHFRTSARKACKTPRAVIVARFMARSLVMGKYAMTAIATTEGVDLAAISGVQFGQHWYYLTGGSEVDNGGAAWHLMLAVIRDVYDRTSGTGKCLMGPVRQLDAGWENLARSRTQCRVSEFPSSTVTFSYSPATGKPATEVS